MDTFYKALDSAERCFIIAEVGVNHNGSIEMAKQLIEIAKASGADAVKFQTFFASELVTSSAAQVKYQTKNMGKNGTQFDMLKRLELSPDQYKELKSFCDELGIIFLSTPFSERAAKLLYDIGVDGFKVSSGDLTHTPLLQNLALYGKPVILSTGMGNLSEIECALSALQTAGLSQIAILHCVSNYPAKPEECNLKAIDTIAHAFGLPTGWSDHTLGHVASIAAVARGSKIIEKHFTLDRNLPGPDHVSSLEPDELNEFVKNLRITEQALGNGIKRPTESEKEVALGARRSITLSHDLPAGHIIETRDLAIRRPGTGISPASIERVLGMRLVDAKKEEHVLSWDDLTPDRN